MSIVKKYFCNIKGSASIELAFVLPVFLLLIFGSIELGFVFWAKSALNYGATYGARYAFAHPTASNATIQSFALSTVAPNSAITYVVSGSGGLAVDIDGTFTYNFFIIPIGPITMTVHEHQVLGLP